MYTIREAKSAFGGLGLLGSGGLQGQGFLRHRDNLSGGFLKPIKRRGRLIHERTLSQFCVSGKGVDSTVQHFAKALQLQGADSRSIILMSIKLIFSEHQVSIPHHAYFDETEDNDLIGVGGWLGTIEDWITFEECWPKALPKEANGDFHYTDFWSRKGKKSYGADWSNERRLEHVKKLACIASDSAFAVGLIFRKVDYEKMIPANHKKQLISPVHFALGHCLRGLLELAKDYTAPPPWRVMFDRKKGQEGTLAELYYKVKSWYDKDRKFGNLSFGNRHEEPPLQAADLLVGELRRHHAGHQSDVFDLMRQKGNLLTAFPKEDEFREYVDAVRADLKAKGKG